MAIKIVSKNGNPTQSGKEQLKDQIKELKASIATIHKEGFEYFEKLLARNLRPKWEKIVKEVCDSSTHITLNGKKVRGRLEGPLRLSPCATNA